LLNTFIESFEANELYRQTKLLRSGRRLRFFDLRNADLEELENAKSLLQEENHVTFVNGADRLNAPRPELVLGLSFDLEKEVTKKNPYLFSIAVGSYHYDICTTRLTMRHWHSHPAYAPIRAARGRKKAKKS
jgi:hypothetical protein